MVSSVNPINSNCDNKYDKLAVQVAGGVIGWETQTLFPIFFIYPHRKLISNQIKKLKGDEFKPFISTVLQQNNLTGKLHIKNLNDKTINEVAKFLGFKRINKKPSKIKKLFKNIYIHILRLNTASVFKRTLKGENAFYIPDKNAVICNFDKFSIPLFHEVQHSINHNSKNFMMKCLRKAKNSILIRYIAPILISLCTMCTRKKEKGEKQHMNDFIKNNCGILTAMTTLPIVLEEFITNTRCIKLAEKAGVKGELLKKVKFNSKISNRSYFIKPIILGISAWAGKIVRDKICEKSDKKYKNI